MNEFSDECLLTFLQNQGQLFAEPVAETVEEAEAFLEDCMAVVVESIEEVREYFEENGMDVMECPWMRSRRQVKYFRCRMGSI